MGVLFIKSKWAQILTAATWHLSTCSSTYLSGFFSANLYRLGILWKKISSKSSAKKFDLKGSLGTFKIICDIFYKLKKLVKLKTRWANTDSWGTNIYYWIFSHLEYSKNTARWTVISNQSFITSIMYYSYNCSTFDWTFTHEIKLHMGLSPMGCLLCKGFFYRRNYFFRYIQTCIYTW